MELRIENYQLPESPKFNYEDLKAEIVERTNEYKMMVYGDGEIKQAKADRASLNRISKALNDERIRLEKEYSKPFAIFKDQVNEIIGIIKDASAVIDEQVKAFENKKAEEKRKDIENTFNLMVFPEFVTLDRIFNPKWMNSTTSMTSISNELNEISKCIFANIQTLESLPEFGFEAVEYYKRTLDLNASIKRASELLEIKKAKEKAEEEKKLREAAEAEAKRIRDEQERLAKELANEEMIEEVVEESFPEVKAEVKAEAKWISFKALLTTPQAVALKAFFDANGIKFEAVK